MIPASLQKRLLLELQNHAYNATDLQMSHIAMEQALYDAQIPNGLVLQLAPSKNPDVKVTIFMTSQGMDICATNGKNTLHTLDHNHSKTHRARCMELVEFFKKERITFASEPSNDFVTKIKNADIGSMINLNNTISLSCIRKEGGVTYFKKQFEGSLSDITIDSFKNSELFAVDEYDLTDIHYLYGRLYSTRTSVAPVRVNEMKEDQGWALREKIERELPAGSKRTVQVGPLKLLLLKNRNDESAWYDASGAFIEKKLIDTIFSWAKNVIPEVNKKEWRSLDEMDGLAPIHSIDYDEWLQQAKFLAYNGKFPEVLNTVFALAKASGNQFSITFDDLTEDENHNFITTTYAFKETDTGRHIYRVSYEDNNSKLWPSKVEPVSEEEFTTYLQHRFVSALKQIHLQEMIPHKTKDEFIRDNQINPFGFTKETINALSEQTAALLENLDDIESEVSAHEFLGR